MDHQKVVIGDATLYCGDCLEIMPGLGMVDAVITDPPYHESTHNGHLSGVVDRQGLGFEEIQAVDILDIAEKWTLQSAGWVVFTCDWHFMNLLEEAGILVRFGIWRKPDGAPQFTGDRPGMGWEPVAICHRPGRKSWNGGGKHGFWTHSKYSNGNPHPTAKPLGLYFEFLQDFSNRGDLILDPFMGSGTTGVACAQLGRKFIGIELDPRYFEIACKRIENAYAQPSLFNGNGEPERKAEQLSFVPRETK